MDRMFKTGMPLVAGVFLIVGIVKFLNGGNWVVWFILAVLFGALRIFDRKSAGSVQGE